MREQLLIIFNKIHKYENVILLVLIQLFLVMFCRYIAVDIGKLTEHLQPNYGIRSYFITDSMKMIEIMRYVLTCSMLCGSYIFFEYLRNKDKSERSRYMPIVWMMVTIGEVIMAAYNSHQSGAYFWSASAFTLLFLTIAVVALGRSFFAAKRVICSDERVDE